MRLTRPWIRAVCAILCVLQAALWAAALTVSGAASTGPAPAGGIRPGESLPVKVVIADPRREVDAVLESGRVSVPVRTLVEALGGKADWDPVSDVLVIRRGVIVVKTAVGSSQMTIDGQVVRLDRPVLVREGRARIALRPLAGALGALPDWQPPAMVTLHLSSPASVSTLQRLFADLWNRLDQHLAIVGALVAAMILMFWKHERARWPYLLLTVIAGLAALPLLNAEQYTQFAAMIVALLFLGLIWRRPQIIERITKFGPFELGTVAARVSQLSEVVARQSDDLVGQVVYLRDAQARQMAPGAVVLRIRRRQAELETFMRISDAHVPLEDQAPREQSWYCKALYATALTLVNLVALDSRLEPPDQEIELRMYERDIDEAIRRLERVQDFSDEVLRLARIGRSQIDYWIGWAHYVMSDLL